MAQRWKTLDGKPPRIIAHRGASGHRPEHTLEAYVLALDQGAEMLEPDIVASRDGVLFARHDFGLARSTDVASRPEFATRAREVAGIHDWWMADFDAAEIETLWAIQPVASRGTRFDGRLGVARFGALLDLVALFNHGRAVPVVIEAEIKQPDDAVLAALRYELESHALTGPHAPVWIECSDIAFLRRACEQCGNPGIALLEDVPREMAERVALFRDLASWVRGVAPRKDTLWGEAGRDTDLVAVAHDAGLEVHAWTFRDDGDCAPFSSPQDELVAAFALGVDALFCDFPDTALAVRDLSARR